MMPLLSARAKRNCYMEKPQKVGKHDWAEKAKALAVKGEQVFSGLIV
jgi:hypothetical protein